MGELIWQFLLFLKAQDPQEKTIKILSFLENQEILSWRVHNEDRGTIIKKKNTLTEKTNKKIS